MKQPASPFRTGLVCAVSAYILWGLMPLFWRSLSSVGPLQILACRILFSLLFTAVFLGLKNGAAWPKLLRKKRTGLLLFAASMLNTVNWGAFIWAVNSGRSIEASLGNYISPFFSILLGLLILKEKLLPLQWGAFVCAAAGVGLLAFFNGIFPWVSLVMAVTFSLYGFIKKMIPQDTLETLAAEALIAAPLAAVCLFIPAWGGTDYASLSPALWTGLVLTGLITLVPLWGFSRGAQLLPLSVLGFLQFIHPTIQLFLGILIFKEPFPPGRLAAFCFIWLAMILFSIAPVLKGRKNHFRKTPG